MIAQPKPYRRLVEAIRGPVLGVICAMAAMLPGAASASVGLPPLALSAGTLLRPAGGPPCAEPCPSPAEFAPAGYAERGYDDPIAREIERLDAAPAAR